MGLTLLQPCPESTVALFGIPEVDILDVSTDDGGVTVLVQTPAALVGCAGCGVVATGNTNWSMP